MKIKLTLTFIIFTSVFTYFFHIRFRILMSFNICAQHCRYTVNHTTYHRARRAMHIHTFSMSAFVLKSSPLNRFLPIPIRGRRDAMAMKERTRIFSPLYYHPKNTNTHTHTYKHVRKHKQSRKKGRHINIQTFQSARMSIYTHTPGKRRIGEYNSDFVIHTFTRLGIKLTT